MINRHLQIMLDTAKAMDSAEEAEAMVEARYYERATPLEATLALSKAKVDADRALERLAQHIALLERSAAALEVA